MNEPPMTERTPISLGLVMTIVGAIVMIVGAFVWLQADVAALKQHAKDQEETAKRLYRLELLMCATDEVLRARACEQMGILR